MTDKIQDRLREYGWHEDYRLVELVMDATGVIAVTIERAIADAMTGRIKGHHDKEE